LRFIEEVQDIYFTSYHTQKDSLFQKLELLKKPVMNSKQNDKNSAK